MNFSSSFFQKVAHIYVKKLTLQPVEAEKATTAHIGKACTWILHEHQLGGSDALPSRTEDEAAK